MQAPLTRGVRWRGWLAPLGWVLSGLYFTAAALLLGLQYLILPNIEAYAPVIERAISRSVGERVTIGKIHARWEGLHAELDLSDLRIYDGEGRLALQLPTVAAVIGWRSIALGSLRLYSLALDGPDLHIRRDAQGRVFIAGFQLRKEPSSPGTVEWLLSQPEFVVRNAKLAWDDELRGAPTLALSGVDLVIQNGVLFHRFAMRAQAADGLASALDLRGEFIGKPPENLLDWHGRLFAQFEYAELEVWQRWIDYPHPVRSGRGALRLWLSLDRHRITEATADVSLADVRAQLAPELPLLNLEYLHGRLHGRDAGRSLEFSGRSLGFKAAGGVAVAPADFDVSWERVQERQPARREVRATALQLGAFAHLAELLPISEQTRMRLARSDPQGTVHNLKLEWTEEGGEIRRYSARGNFSRLGLQNLGPWGGFSGVNGTVDASESGGSLRLESDQASLNLPGILPEQRAQLDSLFANVSWTVGREQLEFKFDNVAVANRDLVGTLHGSYSTGPEPGPGSVDLTASFPKIDAKAAYRYIPLLPAAVGDFLKSSVQQGQLTDARMRLKGELARFPFPGGKSGIFEFSAKIANTEFEFSPDWPKVSAISGELRFEGARMQVIASRASMLGAKINNLRAQIPDLYHGDEVLQLEGLAEGPVSEFLRFIDVSPVGEHIDLATRSMDATGPGRLQLRLEVPIGHESQTQVAGQFEFLGDQFTFYPQLPPLTQLNGRLDFTENALAGSNLSAQIFGGPTSFSLSTRADGIVSVAARGNASMAALQKMSDSAWLQRASGTTAWNATATLGKGRFDLQLESPLAGVAIDLPEPLGKSAGEVRTVRLTRTNRSDVDFLRRAQVARLPENGDAVAISVGRLANGVFVRSRSGDAYVIQSGAVGINEAAPALEAGGVVVSGTFASLDLDRWRAVLKDDQPAGSDLLKSVTLAVDALDVAGKRFNDVKLRATPVNGGWDATVNARELNGSLSWQPGGRGRIVARLKHFTVPESSAESQVQQDAGGELPALDITAEEFVLRDKQLGHLELNAVNEARDWRIEKLVLASPDGIISASGLWQSWASRPSVSLNVRVEASDAGKFLLRLGYPGTLKGGTATLEGKVGWLGSPQTIDYPTLTGEVRLHAGKGQFLRADPGIAKLLGILSLQSWITLDFREFFGEGFVFESISSDARITKGTLATEDFAMSGKAAQVSMSGTVDLAQETQNLKVRVVPSVGGSVSSILVVLANPVWGLGSLVLQRVLKDPLDRIFAFEYAVKGTWSDPKVEPLRAEALPANPYP